MSVLNITPGNFDDGTIKIGYSIHQSSDLQLFIDKWEKRYLQEMLGCALYDLFVADLVAGIPQNAIYLSIYNEFCVDENNCGRQKRSEGIIEMIEKFIYWKYTRDQKVRNTPSGNVVNENEASRETDFPATRIYTTYNEGVESYCSIQWYICDNSTDYPTYNGITKQKTSWL
jgi:hypothetical protein